MSTISQSTHRITCYENRNDYAPIFKTDNQIIFTNFRHNNGAKFRNHTDLIIFMVYFTGNLIDSAQTEKIPGHATMMSLFADDGKKL